ncbi:hypothetical protein JXA05_01865 [Candidatus Peregrinibacteria bacterium]|nr:hypothetical protein [Candidatus Peregrinibacteria bacterium]
MKIIRHFSKVEKIAVAFLGLAVLVSGLQIGFAFYDEYADITPVEGGMYTEGGVGSIDLINPVLVRQGSLADDIAKLVFSGLTKYDTKTGEIVPDLADFKVSGNGKEYTFVIKENAKWHDGKPVTADDALFTYNSVIRDPAFKGAALDYNDYSGIRAVKIDGRTLQFLLEKSDSFFLVKTMTGLLPKHLLENQPVEALEQSLFNYAPVGSGPYRFVTLNRMADHDEVSLQAFEDYYGEKPHIKNILIKAFSAFKDLYKKRSELDGIRSVPADYRGKILERGSLALEYYRLPQYVAVFINSESPKLKNSNVRLALQLGTDKEGIVKTIGETKMVDTPLLEIDQENWVNQYSIKKANGALFETEWQIPNKEEVLKTVEKPAEKEEEPEEKKGPEEDTAAVYYINSPNEGKDFQTNSDFVTITGTAPKGTKEIWADDYKLAKYSPGDPGWSYIAAAKYDNLKKGKNIFKIYAVSAKGEKEIIDSIAITYGPPVAGKEELEKIQEENEGAATLPFRMNKQGETLTLNLVTVKTPETYGKVAEMLKEQWKKIGVEVNVEILESGSFQERLAKREYDLLIFGQNLGYNLDAYPYWHSSQAKAGGYNLSNFKNFVVDSLLEKARLERDEEDRKKTLTDIQKIINTEVPAIFLYSPTYAFALSEKIQNASFDNLATLSDRYSRIGDWYARSQRKLKKGVGPVTLLTWLIKQF